MCVPTTNLFLNLTMILLRQVHRSRHRKAIFPNKKPLENLQERSRDVYMQKSTGVRNSLGSRAFTEISNRVV